MKVIYNSFLPPPGFSAMMLFGVIFARKSANPISARTIRHETIHKAQAQQDFGSWFLFYIMYIWRWMRAGFSYRGNPFEKEAYAKDNVINYTKTRKKHSWKNYI